MAQQINFYSLRFQRQKKHFSAATMLQALGILALGTLLVYGYVLNQSRSLAELAVQTHQQAAQQREQLVKLGAAMSPGSRSRLALEEIDRLGAQLAERRAILQSMQSGALGNSAGFSQYLSAFARQALPGVWLVGIRLGGDSDELVLRGRVLRAELVPAYIRALNREEVMRGRTVADLKLAAREATARNREVPARGPDRYIEFDLTAPRKPLRDDASSGTTLATPAGRAS